MGDGLHDGQAETARGNGHGTVLHTVAFVPDAGASAQQPQQDLRAVQPRRRRSPRHGVRSLLAYLPRGNMLSDEVFRKRHNFLCVVLGLHVPALYFFGLSQGFGAWDTALEMATPLG